MRYFLDNADGNGNIPARYQDRYQNGSFEVVLVFVILRKNHMNNMKILKEKLMYFMVLIMPRRKSLYMEIPVQCKLY